GGELASSLRPLVHLRRGRLELIEKAEQIHRRFKPKGAVRLVGDQLAKELRHFPGALLLARAGGGFERRLLRRWLRLEVRALGLEVRFALLPGKLKVLLPLGRPLGLARLLPASRSYQLERHAINGNAS